MKISMELWKNDTDGERRKHWEKKPVPVPLCTSQISPGVTWNQT